MLSILVVDDEPESCLILKDFFTAKGHRARIATSGREAMALMDRGELDLVLLDVEMPEMSGIEVLRKIREKDEETPVLMVTAVDEVETAVSAMRMGAYDYVTKPVDFSLLELSMERALERGRLVRENREYKEGLEHKVRERTMELETAMRALRESHEMRKEAHLDTIYRLSLAAEFRDQETAAHLRRMSGYSAAIARSLGWDEDRVEIIRVASVMHDIGKIGVPDSILLKPGKLTDEEFNEMKKHTIIGAEILAGSRTPFLQMAEAIALTHHEKYDGTGYPLGLKGEDIPLEGRIVALADVFDALTSKRVYKPQFPNEEAYRIIREKAGNHLDPNAVRAFFERIEEIEEHQRDREAESWEGILHGSTKMSAALKRLTRK